MAAVLGLPKLDSYINRVEHQLEVSILTNNPYIRQPVKRLLKAHSKRLRPALLLAIVRSHNKAINRTVIDGCVAIELLHIASLIHDDIMDHAMMRWGKPTINGREGDNHAILIGDYLFGLAFSRAAQINQTAAGLIGQAMISLCDGQSREIGDEHNLNRTTRSLALAHSGKTAALFETACRLGAICGGLSPAQINNYGAFGDNFGMAFQSIDDLLDLLSTPQLIGKPVGNDISEGVYTMPLLLALKSKQAPTLRALLKSDARKSNSRIIELLFDSGAINGSLDLIKYYNQAASAKLKTRSNLADLPDTYFRWSMTNLVAKTYQNRLSVKLD